MSAGARAAALDARVRTTADPAAAVVELKARLARVRALCEAARADSVSGDRTDVELVSPSEILAILDGER